MISFDQRTGPSEGAPASAYPSPGVPDWYTDAKLGFFLHWGLYSVPAFAVRSLASNYTDHVYAEWYGNTVRLPGSATRRWHDERFGVGTTYEDFAERWRAESFDAAAVVALLARAGGRYVIPTAKHHDGFCLWDTATTSFNAVRRGPHRDLVAELSRATVAAGLRFGVYFSGALDWHVSQLPPITNDADLFRLRRNDAPYAGYAAAQVTELIDRFRPAVLWNDIDWPDAGKGTGPDGVAALLRHHRDVVPDGATNDRWGVPYHGFLTREYQEPEASEEPWEATRGLGRSFGYNQLETDADLLGDAELVWLLVDVVSKGGNLLLNVGLDAAGTVPAIQSRRLESLGVWLATNEAAVYGSRPCPQPMADDRVRATWRDGVTYVFVRAGETVRLPDRLAVTAYNWLGSRETGLGASQIVAPAGLGPVAVAAFA